MVVEARDVRESADYPDRVAGRPAGVEGDPPVVDVRLRDDAGVELHVSAPDSAGLADTLVPLLLTG